MYYYPLKIDLTGMYQPYMWGGRKLAKTVNAPEGEPVAELWAISDRPEEGIESVVANGPLAGKTLAQLTAADALGFLGFATHDHHFPILVKILDSRNKLSVQVHPPEEVAARLGKPPKAESWLFLPGCEPDATVYAGFRRGTTKESFMNSLNTGDVEPLLHRISAQPGTMVNVPNGRVHGVNEGCFILETQQNSNTTYRVFDYNRVDPKTGTSRPLHVEEALASLNFEDYEPTPEVLSLQPTANGARTMLLATPYFSLERFAGAGEINEATQGVATIVVNTQPSSELHIEAYEVSISLRPFEFALIPAAVGAFMVTGDDLDYVLIRPTKPVQ